MATYKDLFDESFYLSKNADVAAAVKAGTIKSGFDHYNAFGFREGRDPNALFDSSFYLLNNLDVFQKGLNPLEHYFNFGGFEGRDPSAIFDSSYYIQTNADVANSVVNPLWHFINFGGKEGRDPSPGFDSSKYLADNPDVSKAGINPLIHYIQFGQKEGRAAFDVAGNKLTGEPSIPDSGQSNTLDFTLAADNLSGTAGNDSGRAPILVSSTGVVLPSISSADNANFGEGNDFLEFTLNGGGEDNNNSGANFGPRPTLVGLEELRITTIGGVGVTSVSFDAGGTTGLAPSTIKVVRGAQDLTVNNISPVVGVTIEDPVTANADNSFLFVNSLVSGTADAITVTLANAGVFAAAGSVNVAGQTAGGFETINLVSKGTAANTLTDIGSVATTVFNGVGNIIGSGAATKYVISGDRNLTITNEVQAPGTLTVDASAFTGNLVMSVDNTRATNVTGGNGADTINFSPDGAGYNTTAGTLDDIFNGGGGIDRAMIRNADLVNLTQSQTNLTAVEEVQVQDDFTNANQANFQHFNSAGVNDFFFTAGSSTGGTINYSSADVKQTFGNSVDFANTLTVNHTSTTGVNDVITTTLNDADMLGGLIFNGFETVNLVSNKAGSTLDGAANLLTFNLALTGSLGAPTALKISGAADLTLSSGLSVQANSIDASAFTGKFTMDKTVSTTSANGVAITGGSGADLLVGTANVAAGVQDTIIGSGGNDKIYHSNSVTAAQVNQGDTYTGGDGNDTFYFSGESYALMLQASSLADPGAGATNQVIRVTDFVAGADKLAFIVDANSDGVADAATPGSVVVGSSVNIAAAANLGAVYTAIGNAVTASTALQLQAAIVTVNSFAGGAAKTFLFVNDQANAAVATLDTLVDITGVSGTISANDFAFA